MNSKLLTTIIERCIYTTYLITFFITPLLVSFNSSELFEFPKMLFVYSMASIVAGLWIAHIIVSGKFIWKFSLLDFTLLLFVGTQLISTIGSIHPYTSWWGYYSRSHGSMWSTFSYAILTWGLVRFATYEWFSHFFLATLTAASISSLYAVAEHLGIDSKIWVQDVQNRVFSTLGQPNWLSAWLGTLLPFLAWWIIQPLLGSMPLLIILNLVNIITSYALTYLFTGSTLPVSGQELATFLIIWMAFNIATYFAKIHKKIIGIESEQNTFVNRICFILLFVLLLSALLFTKSKSASIGLFASSITFALTLLFANGFSFHNLKTKFNKNSLFLLASFLIPVILFGTVITPALVNRESLNKSTEIFNSFQNQKETKPSIETPKYTDKIISDSKDIRFIVWQGALSVWKRYPLFGSGTETFGYAYYLDRPLEHNNLSEWDFIYNKAHNEYINYLANNGILGLSAALSLLVLIIWLCIKDHFKWWLKLAVTNICLLVILYFLLKDKLIFILQKLLLDPKFLWPILIGFVVASGFVFLSFLFLKLLTRFPIKFVLNINTKSEKQKTEDTYIFISAAVLSSLIFTFICNFYGFSVVSVALNVALMSAFIIRVKSPLFIFTYKFTFLEKLSEIQISLLSLLTLILPIVAIFQISLRYQGDFYFNLSKRLYAQNELILASQAIDKAIDASSENSDYYFNKANILTSVAYSVALSESSDSAQLLPKIMQQTLVYTKAGIEKNPISPHAYRSAGSILQSLGAIDPKFFDTAIVSLKAAQILSPTDPQILLSMAKIYEKQDKLDEAIEVLQLAVKLKPNYRRAWHTLGTIYAKQKNTEKSKEAFQFILDNIDPNDQVSKDNLK